MKQLSDDKIKVEVKGITILEHCDKLMGERRHVESKKNNQILFGLPESSEVTGGD